MAWVVADRVKDSSTSTGVGPFTVTGTAPSSFQTFSAVLSVSDTFPYFIEHQTANEWEVGLGTYTGANIVTRTAVLASSSAGAAVNFSGGTKNIEIAPNARHFTGISSQPDGTTSSGSNIGRLVFSTQVSGAAGFTEALRIDNNQRIVIGGSAAQSGSSSSSILAPFQMNATNQTGTTAQIFRWQNNLLCGRLEMLKSRGTAIGSRGVVTQDTALGTFQFCGDDGFVFHPGAAIDSAVDSFAASSNSMPGRLVFSTTTSGAIATTEALRIDSNGVLIMSTGGKTAESTFGFTPQFQMHNTSPVTTPVFALFGWANAVGGAELDFHHSKSNTPGTQAALSANDRLGAIGFTGSDGLQFRVGAAIIAFADGNFSSNSSPGRIAFSTTTSGSSSLTERLRITARGEFFFTGNAGISTVFEGSGVTPFYEFVAGSGGIAPAALAVFRFEAASNGSGFMFNKSRNATIGSHTAVNAGDGLGHLIYNGSDGTAFQTAAVIAGIADGTPTSANVPGRLSFFTAASGAGTNSTTERLRIDSTGKLITGGISAVTGLFGDVFGLQLHVGSGSGNRAIQGIFSWTADVQSGGLYFHKARGNNPGTPSAASSGDRLGLIEFSAYDGFNWAESAKIDVAVEGAPSSNSTPSKISFATCTSGSTSPTERLRIDSTGATYFPSAGTTSNAANAVLDNLSPDAPLSNKLVRSTSSLRYKSDVTPVPQSRLDAVTSIRAIEFNSLASADDHDARFIGFAAEEVAGVDPTLVHFDREGRPDGVQYDRVLLLKVAKLEQELAELKARLH